MITLRAIEFMKYGIDISSFSDFEEIRGFVNSKTGKYISRLTENVKDFIFKLEDDAKEFLGIQSDLVVRHERKYKIAVEGSEAMEFVRDKQPDITLTKDIIVKTMQAVYAKKFTTYSGISEELLDPTLKERLAKIDAEFQRNARPTSDIVEKLSKTNTKRNFGIVTAASYHQYPDVRDMMLNYFNVDKTDFNITTLKDFEIIDDRIYIGVSEADMYRIKAYMENLGQHFDDSNRDLKYIVVSKNLYDYYFCSYGSEFQSCYAVTSPYKGWFGMFPYGTTDGHFIIYGTKDKAIKVGMTNESQKWSAPYMYFRCWGWASTDNKILLDRAYTNRQQFFDAVKNVLLKDFFTVDSDSSSTRTRSGADCTRIFNEYKLKFYPDSVRVDDDFKFRLLHGDRENRGRNLPEFAGSYDTSLKNELDLIKSVSDSFNPAKDYFITSEGRLVNPKVCPITRMMIDEEDDKSFYAKFLNYPLEDKQELLVMTYCDGYIKLDAATKYFDDNKVLTSYKDGRSNFSTDTLAVAPKFSDRFTAIKPVKEFLKGHIDKSPYALAILRVVEGEKNTYIKYKKTGVKA